MIWYNKNSDLMDKSKFVVQTDNAIENILRKAGIQLWLETCGPTSAVNCMYFLGHNITILLPGGYMIQPEDALTVWMNDPHNAVMEAAARQNLDPNNYEDNEIPQYYPVALKAVFGVNAEFAWSNWTDVTARIKAGQAVMICLKNPGHFLAVVGWDDSTSELIYRDSWPGRTHSDGFNLRMGLAEFQNNTQGFIVAIHPKES